MMAGGNAEAGKRGEALAESFLCGKGLRIVERRVRYPCGELDLVARDGAWWIFVEVKARSGPAMGGAAAAFSSRKAGRMKKAVEMYVHRHGLEDEPIRCDLVTIDAMDSPEPRIRHLPGCLLW